MRILNKLEYPSPYDALCQVWLKLIQWFWRIFKILSMYFPHYLPMEKAGPLFKQTWVLITQGCFVPCLVKIGSVALVNVFWLFIIISPWKKVGPFIWTWVLITQGCIVPSLVEIGPVVLEKKTFKYFQYNFNISLSYPLGKGRGPSFEQTWIPFTQGCFVPNLVENGPVVLKRGF